MRLIAILFLLAANLLPAADLSLVASATAPTVGQTVTVQVNLANAPAGIYATQLRLDFDKTRLAFVSATKDANASSLTNNDTVATVNSSGSLKILQEYPASTTTSGLALTVTFTALATGAATVTAIPKTQPFGCVVIDASYAQATLNLPASPLSLNIGSAQVAPAITSTAPTTATAGVTFTYTIATTGNPAPTLTASGLPSWLTLSGNVLSGKPTSLGQTGNIIITASNGVGTNATQTINLAVSRKSGDVNLDGAINATDVVLIKQAFGGTSASADLNGDSRVDIFDLVAVKQNFGN